MSDTWSDIQAAKSKTSSMRERLAKRRKEREALMGIGTSEIKTEKAESDTSTPSISKTPSSSESTTKPSEVAPVVKQEPAPIKVESAPPPILSDPEAETHLLVALNDIGLVLPVESGVLASTVCKELGRDVATSTVENLLQKFSAQRLISIMFEQTEAALHPVLTVTAIDHNQLSAFAPAVDNTRKRKLDDDTPGNSTEPDVKQQKRDAVSVESLLLKESAKEMENKKYTDEILALLSKPTANEKSLVEKFKSQGGPQLKEFCAHGTRVECREENKAWRDCNKLHFRKILHKHTDEQLGDCSFLNTCFHMDTCKYVHYEIDPPESEKQVVAKTIPVRGPDEPVSTNDIRMIPHQWVQCDLRFFDMKVLGKFAVIMADPPWDIHMELPYGTMADDEMRRMAVPYLQDDGYLFLWVTGRAMELGRECMKLWGYERCDELIWVKTNQLQRIIRTGRTGHWFNHGKEHCLIGVKGNPKNITNRGLDCDVIVAEVRATSHKPDEVYGIIERLSPGTRKIELFGRPHNVQPNWVTLGNQVDGVKLVEPDVVMRFKRRYPNGYKLETDNPKSDKGAKGIS
ncbi:unnamed protein product [Owenia fusiformis]|uniref:mRNA m(6)A methyltransferase n=1 Tax=Owenia fusiformis TaxID=6347 RepID=A0A8J1URB9_OWEFU|nr:unnamed protein product [Owenia fusiformis]